MEEKKTPGVDECAQYDECVAFIKIVVAFAYKSIFFNFGYFMIASITDSRYSLI